MKRRFTACLFGVALLALLASPAWAQVPAARIKAIQAHFNQILKSYNKMPAKYQKMLDGNANLIQLARTFPKISANLSKPNMNRAVLQANLAAAAAAAPTGLASVNNNKTDLDLSSFAGYTQSETSTARCGNQVVVGFNDSGSALQTLPIPTIGLSFSGAAVSSNGGASFTDVGYLNPGPVSNFIAGDPGVSCVDSSTFYYTQIFTSYDSNTDIATASVALSKSTDGGHTWGEPVITVNKDGFYHEVDKTWSTIDPSNPSNIYVSYTDFDFSGTSATCPNDFRNAIEVVASTDGGQTFGNPTILDEECGASNNGVQDSHVAVSSNGTVYVAWEWFNNFPYGAHEARVASFTPGASPGPIYVAAQIVPGGDTYVLQGTFRDFIDLDFAVDHSGGVNDGVLYLTWADGRDKSIPDLYSFSGAPTYAFDDVMFSASYDGGQSWNFFPTKVNSDTQPRTGGFGHDHYQPGIAVDPTGNIAICWYDRRNDSHNFLIQRFCGESSNGGYTWSNLQVPAGKWGPSHGNDILVNSIYEGDYDGLTSDTLKTVNGFIGAFGLITDGANPDVKAYAFQ